MFSYDLAGIKTTSPHFSMEQYINRHELCICICELILNLSLSRTRIYKNSSSTKTAY